MQLSNPLLRLMVPALIFAVLPVAAQSQTESQFIASVDTAIANEVAALGTTPIQPILIGGNLVYANGMLVAGIPLDVLLAYVDGLKASGVERVELNPGTVSINDPHVATKYDAVVQHIRQLGMRLAINPEFMAGDSQPGSFADFQSVALQTYPQLAARYQPDNFVIVHEPDTMSARMGDYPPSVAEWDAFIQAVAPLIQQASPHTQIGAGCFYNSSLPTSINDSENAFFQDFASIPALNFLTMDVYSTDFAQFTQWATLAHSVNKGVYIEEVWAPNDLPNPLPANWASEGSLDNVALIGSADAGFAAMDQTWLSGMSQFASANGMQVMTAFTTETFFAFGTYPNDKIANPIYIEETNQAILAGQLMSTSQAYLADSNQWGIQQAVSVSSASFATLPSFFNPSCGTPTNPCNPNSTVAPASLVSAFGLDLANATASDGTFPTTLGGTTMTLVDSSNTSYPVQLSYVTPHQVNYYIPAGVQPGPATITITSGDGSVTTGIVLVAPVMPGLYTANANGQGVAAAIAICAGVCEGWPNGIGNGQFYQDVFLCNTEQGCVPQPIEWQPADTVVIEFFGTGFRNAALSAITATINNQDLPVLYGGAQGQYLGLDQVNVQIPSTLAGVGPVQLALTAQGVAANAVTLDFQ